MLIKRPVRGRLFGFTKFSPPMPPPLHYVLPSIAPSLYKLLFSFLAHIYLRHGKIFPHGETWPLTFMKVTYPKTIFSSTPACHRVSEKTAHSRGLSFVKHLPHIKISSWLDFGTDPIKTGRSMTISVHPCNLKFMTTPPLLLFQL